jgi:hypothetical protein
MFFRNQRIRMFFFGEEMKRCALRRRRFFMELRIRFAFGAKFGRNIRDSSQPPSESSILKIAGSSNFQKKQFVLELEIESRQFDRD